MKRIILNLTAALVLAVTPAAALAGNAYAACAPDSTPKGQVENGLGQTGNCDASGVSRAIRDAVEILSIIAGAAGLIAIIWAGFKYITSGGDSGKISNAKNTLIYALIGLAIAAVAQILVNFVITESQSALQCPAGKHLASDGVTCVKD